MKNQIVLVSAMVVMAISSCQKPYDPIGNNRPAPLLSLNPSVLAFDGKGGTASATIESNVETLSIGEYPDWIESVSVSEDGKTVTVTAKMNEDESVINYGSIRIETQSGASNEAVQYLRLAQAAKDAVITYDPLDGKELDMDIWKPSGEYSYGTGFLALTGDGDRGSEVMCLAPSGLLTQPGNINTISVDIKGGEGGLRVYVNEDPEASDNWWEFFFNFNESSNTGSVYAFSKGGPAALGDQVPGNPLNTGEVMEDIPPLGARDEYFRMEITNISTMPNWWQSVLNIYSLQTRNGVTTVLKKHYTRKFEFDNPKPTPGYVSIWGRGGTSNFKNFTISAQNTQSAE